MKPKDDLFRLIKSLSQGEKRQLKLSALPGTQNQNYLRLFDAIDHQPEYNEAKIKKKFAGEKFVKHLSSEKNYLQTSLLKLFRNNPEEQKSHELLMGFAEVEFLTYKGLFDLALDKIRKLTNEAELYCCFGMALDMLLVERNIFLRSNRSYAIERYESWGRDVDRVQDKMKNLGEYMKINNYCSILMLAKGNILGDEQQKEYKRLMHTGIMRNVKSALSPCSVSSFYLQKTSYYKSVDDMKNLLKYSALLVNHFENHKEIVIKSPENFIIVISNHIHYLFLQGKMDEALAWNDKLARFPEGYEISLSAAAIRNKTIKTTISDIAIRMKSPEPIPLEECAKSIRELIKRFSAEDEFQKIALMFHLAGLYFIYASYKEALAEFNKLANEKTKGIASHYRTLALILIVLIHIDKGNLEMVPYLTRKFKFPTFTETIKLLADFITGPYANANSETERIRFLKAFRNEYVNHAGHRNIEHAFSFLEWMDARIQRKTLLQFISGKK